MRTRGRLTPVTALTALTALVSVVCLSAAATATTPATATGPMAGAALRAELRPNIVVIMVDDMRSDDLRFMPRTRRVIGDAGVVFSNSFSPHPLCCPARASFLSGRYTHNHRVFGVTPPYAFPSFDDRSTLATWLQDAGYRTTYLGKYLNGYGPLPAPGASTGDSTTYVPPGWTTWRASIDGGLPSSHPEDGSTYRYYDTTLSRNGEGFENFAGRYQTRVYGDLSEEIIRAEAAQEAPFFLYASYTAPHNGKPHESDDPEPVTRSDGRVVGFATPARPAYVHGLFDAVVRAAPGRSWVDPDITDKPRYLRKPAVTSEEWLALREVTRQRAEALWVVDRQVERTIDALAASGELDRTLVVFTSDNGYFLGEQRVLQGKIWPHEPSLRVPLLMRGPGIPALQTRTDPITSLDVAPTLAEAAGTTPGGPVDGISLLGVARSGDRGWTRAVLTETGPVGGIVRATDEAGGALNDGERPDVRYAIGVRTPRYLYVDVATGERELYDLRTDPSQYHNLATVREYADERGLLARELHRLRACAGVECSAPMPDRLIGGP